MSENLISDVTLPTSVARSEVSARAMSHEDELVLLLARGQLTPEVRSRALELLAASPQWPLVLERAYSHEVYPLLYRNLCDLEFRGVPDQVQAELKRAYLSNAVRNQLFAEELERLLRLLGDAGIPVIPLKGVTLAQALYGDPGARVCADIDILVPPENVTQALDLILAAGYRTNFDNPFFSKLELRHGRHYDVVREGRGISFLVEVHWILIQHSSKNNEANRNLWATARPETYFGACALSLSPEWEFLYLCVHAAGHEWEMLKWLVDIHQLATCGVLDWQQLASSAEALRIDPVIRQTLGVCSLLLGTPLPLQYSPATRPAGMRVFPNAPIPKDARQAAFVFGHLRVLTQPWDRLRYIAAAIFVPKLTDQALVRLPSSMGFLYYVIRPPRLVYKWVRRFLSGSH